MYVVGIEAAEALHSHTRAPGREHAPVLRIFDSLLCVMPLLVCSLICSSSA